MQITNPITEKLIIPVLENTADICFRIAQYLDYFDDVLYAADRKIKPMEDVIQNTRNPLLHRLAYGLLHYLLQAIHFLGATILFAATKSLKTIARSLNGATNELDSWQRTYIAPNEAFSNLAILKAKFALLLKLPLDLMLSVTLCVVPITIAALNFAVWLGITLPIVLVPAIPVLYEDKIVHLRRNAISTSSYRLEKIESYLQDASYKALDKIQDLAIKATWAISEVVFSPVTALLYLGTFIANRYKQSAAPLEADQQNSDNCELESEQTSQDVQSDRNELIYSYNSENGFPLREESEKQPLEYGANSHNTKQTLGYQLK